MRRLMLRRLPLLYCVCLICSILSQVASTSATAARATIAGGLFHTCAIVSDLSLRCFGGGSSDKVQLRVPVEWGSSSSGFGNFGQIGTGNNETLGDELGEMAAALPIIDLGNKTVQEVAAGQSHTCVLFTSGDVSCWGYNHFGQLGLGDQTARGLHPADMGEGLAVVDLGTGRTAKHVACGQHNTCAVLDDGSLKCWGYNSNGMLGLGDTSNRGDSEGEMGDDLPAVDLGTGQTAVAVAGGRYHTCAILGSGGLKCWGGGNDTGHNYGQLAQGNTFEIGVAPGQMGDDLPEVDLGTGRTAVALAAGWYHTCVILDNAKLHCFGRNFDGQLGLGDTADRGYQAEHMGDGMVAADLGTDRYPVSVSTGRWHTCVLLDDDNVKCFGANTADDLGEGQLGLGDTENRGMTAETMGDELESVDLGTGRQAGWIFSALDHNCVIFADAAVKCWGLNASGQLGIGNTSDRGDDPGEMGTMLSTVEMGMRVAYPPSPLSFDAVVLDLEEEGVGGLSMEIQVLVYLAGTVGAVFVVGAICLCCRRRLDEQSDLSSIARNSARSSANPLMIASGRSVASSHRDRADELEMGTGLGVSTSKLKRGPVDGFDLVTTVQTDTGPERPRQQLPTPAVDANRGEQDDSSDSDGHSFQLSGREMGMAAAGTAGMVVAGGMAAGWNIIGLLAENLPWIGVAYHLLNEIAAIVDTRNSMQGNLEKIKSWAVSLQAVLVQLAKQMEKQPAVNAHALEHMSKDVMDTLRILVDTVASYNARGTLAQYAASRSCQKAIDAADTALRGALAKLTVGQGAELITMVGDLQGVALVVEEKMDMIIEHLRKQDEHAARLELRLAEHAASIEEVLRRFVKESSSSDNSNGKEQLPPAGKTLRQLGKEELDKLQISKKSVSYITDIPFASGAHSEVYQVMHDGVVKAAKKTNLARLGVGGKAVNRVFERFVKELYIMSKMHSDRVVSVFGAIASPTELTLVMEFLERGSIRTILDDDEQRSALTPAVQHGLLMDTAEGMTYLYENGVEHRDLKSANCLVSHDWRVKISDFGLSNTNDAISTGSISTISSNIIGGTMVYMAPELLPGGAGREVPAELSDIYSFGVVVWDIVCGGGEVPWAGMSMHELPLALKMGKRLDIPDECGRFHKKLMLNCWRENPHRRPNFERVLHAVSKEAGSAFSSTPSLSPPTYAPTGVTAVGAAATRRTPVDSPGIQRASPSSPGPARRVTQPRSAREGPGHVHDSAPSGGGGGGGVRATALEGWSDPSQLSRRDSDPASNAGVLGEPAGLERHPRLGSAPACSQDIPAPAPLRSAPDDEGARTMEPAITHGETTEMGRVAIARRGDATSGAPGRRTWPDASRGNAAESKSVRTPGRTSSRHKPANSADACIPSSQARARSKHKTSRSADSLPHKDSPEYRPSYQAVERAAADGREYLRRASMRAAGAPVRKGGAASPPEPPLPEDRQFLQAPAPRAVAKTEAAVGASTRTTRAEANPGYQDDAVDVVDLGECPPYNLLLSGRTLSLESGIEAAAPASTDATDAGTSRSVSLNMETVRIGTTRSQDAGRPQVRARSRRDSKGEANVQALLRGAADKMKSVPDPSMTRPVADFRELRQSGGENVHTLQVGTPGRRRVDDILEVRGRSGPLQVGGAGGTGGVEKERGAREGRGGIGARRVPPKKNREVQVVHGFRLTTKNEQGEID